MEPNNTSTYKKQSMTSEFTHSCLGKLVILAGFIVLLLIVALLTVPSDKEMRPFTEADTTFNDKEILETFNRNNNLEIFKHALFSVARVSNNLHPEGMREGIGIFGIVIPILNYDDFLMAEGNIRGKHHERIIGDGTVPEMDYGNNPMLKPYHYKGNPDD